MHLRSHADCFNCISSCHYCSMMTTTTTCRSFATSSLNRSLLIRMFPLILIMMICCLTLMPAASAVGVDQQLFPLQREVMRRMHEDTPSRGLGWRKRRYYVGRWGSAGGGSDGQRSRAASRRFVPLSNNDESVADESIIEHDEVVKQQQRLCGLKLTNRTRQLCGDCVPANMRQVILLDKKNGHQQQAFSKERLTEMCCVERCSDDQIRNFCCRGRP